MNKENKCKAITDKNQKLEFLQKYCLCLSY